MASTFGVSKKFGPSGGPTETDNQNYMHLIGADVLAGNANDYQTGSNQITIPPSSNAFSYEAWFRAKWTGTYNTITTVKFWRSSGPNPTGVTYKYATPGVAAASYATPVNTASSLATTAIPTSEPGSSNVDTEGSAPNITSKFVVLQMTVASTASPGDVGESQFTWKWTES